MAEYRRHRNNAVREFVGHHYAAPGDGSSHRMPLNLLELFINIMTQHLAAVAPRAAIRERFPDHRPGAVKLEESLWRLAQDIRLGDSLETVVQDGLFGVGCIKTGLEPKAQVEFMGFLHDVGQPFADAVDLDDLVIDMASNELERVSYIGNDYWVPYEAAMESKVWDRGRLAKLQPDERRVIDEQGEEQIWGISGKDEPQGREYKEQIALRDLWLPLDNLLITLPKYQETDKPLREREWSGPEHGPYRLLTFNKVPGNLLPLPPVAMLRDLNELINSLLRKERKQAERQKTVLGYRAESAEDAERIKNAEDGEAFLMDNPEGAREFKFGGIDQANLAFTVFCKDLYTYVAGNLDMLGGLGPQSQTVGQDKLLAANSSRRLARMQQKVFEFDQGVLRDLAYYIWNDPLLDMAIEKHGPPGSDIRIPTRFTPEDRQGEFLDYEITIEPYSLQYLSPQERLSTMVQLVTQVIMPLLPTAQDPNSPLDIVALIRQIGKLANLESEFNQIFKIGGQPVMETDPAQQERKTPQRAPVSHRTYERVNRPGATTQGKDTALMQTLLGGNPQQAEAASIFRGVG